MTESEIYANPLRIQGLADEIRTFVDHLRGEVSKMQSGIHELGGTWRDNEYTKFKRSFDRLKDELEKIDQEVVRREPELAEDARLLVDYLSKGQ
ncbi:MAG: WXG100 family type VII secretion target [Opitutae bacterium]|nr:WXG100 family type VII secretion target [Opitutae bacterium]